MQQSAIMKMNLLDEFSSFMDSHSLIMSTGIPEEVKNWVFNLVNGLQELKIQAFAENRIPGLQKFVEFAENRIPIYDHNNSRPWVLLFIILAILVHLGWLRLAEDGNNSNNNEEEQSLKAGEEELLTGEIGQTLEDERVEQADERTAAGGLLVVRRHGGCAFCGANSTTRCSRCKAARYCSVECQIGHWRSGHKFECVETKTPRIAKKPKKAKVGMPNNVPEEEDNIQSSSPLLLEFPSENTTSTEPLTEGSLVPIKEAQDYTAAEWACLEEELGKLRNETKLLKSERDKWVIRANVDRERYQSFKKESEHQLSVLKREKELLSNAEKQACHVIGNLSEKLHQLQTELQASIVEKKRQEEYIRMLESDWARTKRELQEEQMRAWWPAASFGKPAIVCPICLTNEKDLAFGCGHMTCKDCGSKLSKCPICRKQINSRVKLFPG